MDSVLQSLSPYSLSLNNIVYKYTGEGNITKILNLMKMVAGLLPGYPVTECRSYGYILGYNILLVPCNLTTGKPRPLCSNSCYYYRVNCSEEYDSVLRSAKKYNLDSVSDCDNTFSLINTIFGFANSSKEFEEDCFDIRGMLLNNLRYICMYACKRQFTSRNN